MSVTTPPLTSTSNLPSDPFAPRPTVSAALRRHWIVASLPVLLLVGLAVAAALKRPPTYTADAHLAVGRLHGQTPAGLVGFAQVTTSLAETYSRSLASPAVVVPAARKLQMPSREVLDSISASPIPESPVFRVRAKAESPRDATRIANVVSDSLVRYAQVLAKPNPSQRTLLSRYDKTLVRLAGWQPILDTRARDFNAHKTSANRRQLARARAAVGTLKLRLRTLQQAYESGQQGPQSSALLSIVGDARSATTDRYSVLQLLVFVALVAGGILGTALAVVRANRRFRSLQA